MKLLWLASAVLLFGLPSLYLWWASRPASLAGIVLYSPEEAPATAALPEVIRVVTWNVAYGYGLGSEAENFDFASRSRIAVNLQRIAKALVDLKADVVLLQEVDFDSRRSDYHNQLQHLSELSGLSHYAALVAWNKRYLPYPSWPISRHLGKVVSGGAVLSRFPLCGHDERRFPPGPDFPWSTRIFYLDRYAQILSLCAIPSLRLVNVHLEDKHESSRNGQLAELLAQVGGSASTFVIGGDFNGQIGELSAMTPRNIRLEPRLDEGPTYWPSPDRLDYFLVDESLEVLDSTVHRDFKGLSDHFPVVLDLKVPK